MSKNFFSNKFILMTTFISGIFLLFIRYGFTYIYSMDLVTVFLRFTTFSFTLSKTSGDSLLFIFHTVLDSIFFLIFNTTLFYWANNFINSYVLNENTSQDAISKKRSFINYLAGQFGFLFFIFYFLQKFYLYNLCIFTCDVVSGSFLFLLGLPILFPLSWLLVRYLRYFRKNSPISNRVKNFLRITLIVISAILIILSTIGQITGSIIINGKTSGLSVPGGYISANHNAKCFGYIQKKVQLQDPVRPYVFDYCYGIIYAREQVQEVVTNEKNTEVVKEIDKTIDSDGDGLTDYDEINIYGTDPNNPDTDGDGYSDGDEVKNGYNPLGAGRLNLLQPDIKTITIDFKNGASFVDLASGKIISDVDLMNYLVDGSSFPPLLLDGVDLWIDSDPEISCISEGLKDDLGILDKKLEFSTLQWFTKTYVPYKLYVDDKGMLTDCRVPIIKEGIVFIVQDENKDYYQVIVKELSNFYNNQEDGSNKIVLEYFKLKSNQVEIIPVSKQPNPKLAYISLMEELNKVISIDDFKKFLLQNNIETKSANYMDILTNGMEDYSPQDFFNGLKEDGFFSQDISKIEQIGDRVGNIARFGYEDFDFIIVLDNDKWKLILDLYF